MENMVHVFLMGKEYEVPSNLTIMGAMEYADTNLFADAVAVTVSAVLVQPYTELKASANSKFVLLVRQKSKKICTLQLFRISRLLSRFTIWKR